jgi:glutaryl-CoA dehydrogenase
VSVSQGSFDWRDPLLLADELSAEERMIADAVRAFARDRLMPLIVDWNRRETFDRALMIEFGDIGLLGGTLDGYGCPGLSHVAYGLACRELEWVDTAFRSALGAQSGLAMGSIHSYGDDDQKHRYLPDMAAGKLIGCFGLTEPDHGSDPSRMVARARTENGGYRLTGTKTWITAAPIADIFIVWARDDDGTIGGFILDRDMDGLETTRITGKFGVRASPTGEIIMDDVLVPQANRLPGAKSLGAALACLSRARFGICWGAMGAAEFCWTASRQYVIDRAQFGRPLAANQLIQKKLADMQTEIALGLQACLRISRLQDEGRASPQMISLVKRNNAGKALDIARMARDMHGANGIADEFHVIRHMLNMEVINTLEGTHDIHALILGRAQTGIAAFSD